MAQQVVNTSSRVTGFFHSFTYILHQAKRQHIKVLVWVHIIRIMRGLYTVLWVFFGAFGWLIGGYVARIIRAGCRGEYPVPFNGEEGRTGAAVPMGFIAIF